MKREFTIRAGTVQPFVSGFSTSPFIQHFGRAEYDRNIPVLSDSLREKAEPIVLALNDRSISEDEGRNRLSRLYY